ncbi:unknown [Akkermansia muciniphila CAG:154]|nr:unknown [Akkermansia muciniphila CAG:154]
MIPLGEALLCLSVPSPGSYSAVAPAFPVRSIPGQSVHIRTRRTGNGYLHDAVFNADACRFIHAQAAVHVQLQEHHILIRQARTAVKYSICAGDRTGKSHVDALIAVGVCRNLVRRRAVSPQVNPEPAAVFRHGGQTGYGKRAERIGRSSADAQETGLHSQTVKRTPVPYGQRPQAIFHQGSGRTRQLPKRNRKPVRRGMRLRGRIIFPGVDCQRLIRAAHTGGQRGAPAGRTAQDPGVQENNAGRKLRVVGLREAACAQIQTASVQV